VEDPSGVQGKDQDRWVNLPLFIVLSEAERLTLSEAMRTLESLFCL
jgi:hypothetical protein